MSYQCHVSMFLSTVAVRHVWNCQDQNFRFDKALSLEAGWKDFKLSKGKFPGTISGCSSKSTGPGGDGGDGGRLAVC